MMQDEEDLKIKLKSVTKLKLCKEREQLCLRNTEISLTEEQKTTRVDSELMLLQLEDLKQDISKMKYQIAMIGICKASEKSKIENDITNLLHHQNDFFKLFSKEKEAMEIQKLEIKKKEQHESELEQHKSKLKKEKSQLLLQETKMIEEECDAIEQECAVLKKRNKAIMLKLRRKLIESEDIRRQFMKNKDHLEPKP